MKKAIVWFNALLPIFYLMMIGLCILIDVEDEPLFIIFGIYLFIGLLLPCLLILLTSNLSTKFLAAGNLWISISNLSVLTAQVIYWLISLKETQIAEANGAMGGGLGLVLLILIYLPFWASYFIARIACTVNCVRILRRKAGKNDYVLYAIMHLLPITDLISAIIVLFHTKKQEK